MSICRKPSYFLLVLFFFFFFLEMTCHFLGQSPSLHIHEEPRTQTDVQPTVPDEKSWFPVGRTIDNDLPPPRGAGLHPVPEECGVFTAFKRSPFPLGQSTKDLTLSRSGEGSGGGRGPGTAQSSRLPGVCLSCPLLYCCARCFALIQHCAKCRGPPKSRGSREASS